jgi:hypothetical protein
MKKITILMCLFISATGFSQTVLEDFEGTPTISVNNAVDGGTLATIEDDPAVGGTHGKVLKFVTSDAGVPWQETQLTLQDTYIDMTPSVATSISVDVYSTEAFDPMIKLVGGINTTTGAGVADSAADAIHTGTGWETLTFDFVAGEIQDGQQLPQGAYSKIIFFNLWDADDSGSGAGSWTCDASGNCAATTRYFDNITGFAGAPPYVGPTAGATTVPAREAANVISIYGGNDNSYSDAADVIFDSFGGASLEGEETLDDGQKVTHVSNNSYHGVGVAAGIDVSAMTKFHMDFYTTTDISSTPLAIKFESVAAGTAQEIAVPIPAGGFVVDQWHSIELDLSTYNSAALDFATLKWISIVTYSAAGAANIFYDNLYFHNDQVLGADNFEVSKLNVYPNPTNGVWNVTSTSQISKISLLDVLGKEVLTLSPNNKKASIDASSLRTGIYFAKIQGANGSKTLKLVRQ